MHGHTNVITIKFDNPYITNRKINSLVFLNVVKNYDEGDKGILDTINYKIDL